VRRPALALVLAAVLVFGWLMPYLAEWSHFDAEAERPVLEFIPFTAKSDQSSVFSDQFWSPRRA
jgi:hypothetical protein